LATIVHDLRLSFRQWLPPVISGIIAWLLFTLLGETPLIRASGLALVIIGVALSLRRMGAILSIIGGLTLALCAAFWSQTGGGNSEPATITIAVILAAITATLITLFARRIFVGIGIGVLIFVLIFWSQIGTPQSLRLSSLATAWLTYLLIDMLLKTNPRPDSESGSVVRREVQFQHKYGALFLLTIGILNDPLITLLIPAIVLALLLTQKKFPTWYWVIVSIIAILGIWGIWSVYLDTPRMLIQINGWRDGARWLEIINLVVEQFSIMGILLGILGLARLSRWYPPLGTVTMTAYAAFIIFGLVYIGPNRETLLLPLLIIQIVWMTYAVYTIGQWAAKTIEKHGLFVQRIIFIGYLLLPITMLLGILDIIRAF